MTTTTKKSKKSLKDIKIEIPKDSKAKATGLTPVSVEERQKINERNNEKIIFSFNFLDLNDELFNLGSMKGRSIPICSEWFITLLETLREISKLKPNEFRSQRQHYDFHQHDWSKVSKKFNFSKEFLEQVDGVQFRLSSSKGRVHGFMIGNRFYVVWLDPHHNLNPDDRYGGIKYYQKPKDCFETLSEENIKLKNENALLLEMLEEKEKQ